MYGFAVARCRQRLREVRATSSTTAGRLSGGRYE